MTLQLPFAAHFMLAALGFAVLGSGLISPYARRARGPLVFSAIYVGQMAVWFAGYLVLPLNALVARSTGHALPAPLLFWGSVVAVGLISRRRTGSGWSGPGWSRDDWAPFLLLGAGGLAACCKVAAIYSDHLGALGLDTHQHIYWVGQILDAGHHTLAARHTEILASYPKAFHALVAGWCAAGGGEFVGPFVKVMPFVQALLPALVFAELLLARSAIADRPAGERALLAFSLCLALLVYAFAWSGMVYPQPDLNSTPRFASSALLMLPYLVLGFALVFDDARLRVQALLSLLPVAILLAATNAVLIGPWAFFLIPLLLLSGAFSPAKLREGRGSIVVPAFICIVLAFAIAFTDPFIVGAWTGAAGSVGDAYLGWLGVARSELAANLGVISGAEFVPVAESRPVHVGAGAIAGLFAAATVETLTNAFDLSGRHFPFVADLFSESSRWAVRMSVVLVSLGAGVALHLRSPDPGETQDRLPFWLWRGLVLGGLVGGLGGIAAWRFTLGLAEGRSYAFVLLRDYTESSANLVSQIAMALILLASIALLFNAVRIGSSRSGPGWLLWLSGLVLVAMPWWLYGLRPDADEMGGFWTKVGHHDIENLRSIEEHIGEWDIVLVPAEPWKIDRERWIIPQGGTASVLPFIRRRVLFNSRLGWGARLSWRDLARFCEASPPGRVDFLRRQDVSWILLKARESASQEFHRRYRLCGASLESLGVRHPPAFSHGDQSLYRVDFSEAHVDARVEAHVEER